MIQVRENPRQNRPVHDKDYAQDSSRAEIHKACQRALNLNRNLETDSDLYITLDRQRIFTAQDMDEYSEDTAHLVDEEFSFVHGPGKRRRVVTVGTDCSGLEVPIQALLNMEIKFKHIFSSDNDSHVRSNIQENFAPEKLYGDIFERLKEPSTTVDLYIAGFPCQSFSTMGDRQGFADEHGRGRVILPIIEYITEYTPRIFILENVRGFATMADGECMKQVLKALEGIKLTGRESSTKKCYSSQCAYTIEHRIMDTKEHGIPQSRPRWYCVGIRKSCIKSSNDEFKFPEKIKCPLVDDFLDPGGEEMNLSPIEKRTLLAAEKKIRSNREGNPARQTFIIDVDATDRQTTWNINKSLCLTRSRHRGFWISNQKRRLNIHERLRLQRIMPCEITNKVSNTEFAKQIGNAMSMNVVERVLLSIFKSTDMVEPDDEDRWKSGEAQRRLNPRMQWMYTNGILNIGREKPGQEIGPIRLIEDKTRKIIMDSGASYHLIDSRTITPEEQKSVTQINPPIKLNTANGVIKAKKQVKVYIRELGFHITAVVLGPTPSVLSMGKLVNENGIKCTWEKDKPLIITLLNSITMECGISSNVPFITVAKMESTEMKPIMLALKKQEPIPVLAILEESSQESIKNGIQYKKGSILEADESYIVQQCICVIFYSCTASVLFLSG